MIMQIYFVKGCLNDVISHKTFSLQGSYAHIECCHYCHAEKRSDDPGMLFTNFGHNATHRRTFLTNIQSVRVCVCVRLDWLSDSSTCMLCIDPRLTSTEDFIDIHGDTALTRIAGFSLWRLLVCVFKLPMHFLCVYTYWCTKFLPGIMPDIMHIFDLALTVDCILSALILWSTPEKLVKHNCCFKTADVEIYLGKGRSILRNGQSREQKLLELKTSYKTYCSETAIKTRASDKLFTTKKLMPAKKSEYPSISQKVALLHLRQHVKNGPWLQH